MTKAALAKLLILILVVLVMCLPEFFTAPEGVKISFTCTAMCPSSDDEMQQLIFLNISQTHLKETILEVCTSFLNMSSERETFERRESGTPDDLQSAWFICETESDLHTMYQSISASGSPARGSLLNPEPGSVTQAVTVTRCLNTSLCHGVDTGQSAFYFLTEDLSSQRTQPPSSNHTYCIAYMEGKNITDMNATVHVNTMYDDWSCKVRIFWLTLILTVVLLVLTVVLCQIYWKTRTCRRKPPLSNQNWEYQNVLSNMLRGEANQHNLSNPTRRSAIDRPLTPIPEQESEEDQPIYQNEGFLEETEDAYANEHYI
nr:PREDICTED: transmembrane protein 156 [Lepisosteus oculatus]